MPKLFVPVDFFKTALRWVSFISRIFVSCWRNLREKKSGMENLKEKKVGWAKRGQVTDGEKNRRKSTRKYLQQTQTSHKLLLLEVGR